MRDMPGKTICHQYAWKVYISRAMRQNMFRLIRNLILAELWGEEDLQRIFFLKFLSIIFKMLKVLKKGAVKAVCGEKLAVLNDIMKRMVESNDRVVR